MEIILVIFTLVALAAFIRIITALNLIFNLPVIENLQYGKSQIHIVERMSYKCYQRDFIYLDNRFRNPAIRDAILDLGNKIYEDGGFDMIESGTDFQHEKKVHIRLRVLDPIKINH